MRLEIQDPEDILGKDFGLWLIERIKQHFRFLLNPKKLILWDKFIDSSEKFVSIDGSKIRTSSILLSAIDSLQVKKLPGKLEVYIPRTRFVSGLDRVRLDSVCRLVTFGNRSIQGYPVIVNTLQHFAENINYYVDLYNEGVD